MDPIYACSIPTHSLTLSITRESNTSDHHNSYVATSNKDSDTSLTQLSRRKACKTKDKQKEESAKMPGNIKEAMDRQYDLELDNMEILKRINANIEELCKEKKGITMRRRYDIAVINATIYQQWMKTKKFV